MHLEEITTLDGLHSIKYEWDQLCSYSLSSTPFQTSHWLIPWWESFGGSTLKTIALRDGTNLIGLGIFFIYHSPEENIRKLCFVGNGISDYLDIITFRGKEIQCKSLILNYLTDISDEWDECDLQDVPHNSSLITNISFPDPLIPKLSVCSICPFLLLPGTLEQFDRNLTKKLRKNIHKALRDLGKKGIITLQHSQSDTLDINLDTCFKLHHDRWNSLHEKTILNDVKLYSFYKNITSNLYLNHSLQIYLLKLDSQCIASYYVLQQPPFHYAYIGGFDSQFEEYSPGTIALYTIIQKSIESNIEIFDFMRGSEHYKYHWNPFTNFNYRLKITKK